MASFLCSFPRGQPRDEYVYKTRNHSAESLSPRVHPGTPVSVCYWWVIYRKKIPYDTLAKSASNRRIGNLYSRAKSMFRSEF